MPTVTKFIIAFCPATPCYLHSATGRFSTSDKSKARVFDTFDAAMEVARTIHGWGGAQRVEQIAVEVPEVPSLATPAGRIEARDAATFAFHEEADRLQDNDAGLLAAVQALRDLGYRAADAGKTSISIADPEGNLLDLDWDPGVDGFDYATSGDDGCDLDEIEANTEAEPETCTCDGCCEDKPEAEMNYVGEGFAFCNACRAKDDQPDFVDWQSDLRRDHAGE
jgi:hypothetical protein